MTGEGGSNRELLGLARGGGLNLAGAFFSQVVVFGITALLARGLGQVDLGLYTQAYAFLALLSLLSLSGFRNALTRFVAVFRADDDAGAMRGTIRLGLATTIVSSMAFGGALFLAAPGLAADVFSDVRLAEPLRFAALALPFTAFTDAALSATQGFKTMRPYAMIGLVVEPAVRVGVTAALVAAGFGLRGAMIALVVSQAVATVLAAVALDRRLRPYRGDTEPATYPVRTVLSFSMATWTASLATQGLIWADTLLLGIYRDSSEVGLYQVATRLVVLATFVMSPINTSFAPRIADLFRRGETESLQRTYSAATSWIVRLSLPGFIALLVFPSELLGVFGGPFRAGAAVTVILALGKLSDAGTGPCGMVLNMADRPGLNAANNVAALALNIGLNIYAIPRHGLTGAAVAWAISLFALNLARVLEVWTIMRMNPFDAGLAKGFLAGAGAAVAAMAAHAGLGGGSVGLAGGLAALALAYLAGLSALGVPPEDRLVLRMLTRRFRRVAVVGP